MAEDTGLIRSSRFNQDFLGLNALEERGFIRWVFHPGMLFASSETWWQATGPRKNPHEGIDFCFFRDNKKQIHSLGAALKVPVMFDGRVVKIDDDFLGKSVFVRHTINDANEMQLCSFYGHTRPLPETVRGADVQAGSAIAAIADTGHTKNKMLPHLHVSVGWIEKGYPCEQLSWEIIGNPGVVRLMDPLELMSCRYETIPHETLRDAGVMNPHIKGKDLP